MTRPSRTVTGFSASGAGAGPDTTEPSAMEYRLK